MKLSLVTKEIELGELIIEVKRRNKENKILPVWSVTNDRGLVNTETVFDKRVHSKNLKNYKIINPEEIAYNPSRINVGSVGINNLGCSGLLSPLYVIIKCQEDLLAKYFFYFLKSPQGNLAIKHHTQGSVRDSLNYKDLIRIKINLPDISSQVQIIARISLIENLIEQNQRLIAELNKLKTILLTQLMQTGFDKNGISEIKSNSTKFKDSELGKIPNEWNVIKLKDCINPDTIITYGIVQPGPDVQNGIPYIRNCDMGENMVFSDKVLRTSKKIDSAYQRSKVKEGEIICAIRAVVGKVLLVPKELNNANLSRGIAKISPHPDINNQFLLWSLRSNYVQEQFQLLKKGSTYSDINLRELQQIKIKIPKERKEQDKISSVLNNLSLKIQNYKIQMNQLEVLKKGVMQKLL